MTEILVRSARQDEAKPISHLLSKCQWFTYRNLYSDIYIQRLINKYYNAERIQREITTIDKSWHGYFVAEKDGKLLGVIGGGMADDSDGEIYVFYMDPDYRGMGIGTRLLEFYTKIQKYTYGAERQWVSVAKGNLYGIPFYEAKGFSFKREEIAYGSTDEDQDISLVYSRQINEKKEHSY
ncbi:GNAT family N-acetyltransferase [Sporosarcina thermotolerans]|uniref:GNAT family N-acetyltransferase n=1 Tax=Sporosarcina thermotolerans TaxID=633404 RepID=A0AAW9AAA3_9BACL|nr:GNAT family N-acetyltransferase [Sporosarcina thermotolerans]MDW0117124.1 GNAT family N-acetyltransferase [Sporosarcina thermotolerans]